MAQVMMDAVHRYEGTVGRKGQALADEYELRPRAALGHLSLGALHRRVGRLDEARAELATAVTMLRAMGMAHWLPEAERELTGVEASANRL